MSDVLTVLLPIRTQSELNLREHWSKRAKRTKGQRDSAKYALMVALNGKRLAGPLTITITRIALRHLDDDNCAGAQKHIRDGIADALGIDDGDPRLTWEYEQEKGAPGEYAVRVEIQRREA